ncbi:MAG: PDZ domain-containing protein [Firmicutes bacterium]|nr:PDZ domain-containing protein [Bacillota bacterium]
MESMIEVNQIILKDILAAMISPLFWVLLGIIAYQYVRMSRLKDSLFGVRDHSATRVTMISLGMGLFGGYLGSIITVLLGITVPESGYLGLLLLAVLLMTLHPRFLCFAYAGGLLSLCSLIFGFPNISVSHLMALVAVLHLIEGILIRVSGHLDALPVYTSQGHLVVGGFNLQKFWPIPLVILSTTSLGGETAGVINMPDWWPLLQPPAAVTSGSILALMPAVVGLGYGEIALASTPQRRSRVSSRNLMVYSLGLLGLSLAASYSAPLQWLAAVYAPVGHEVIIALATRKENGGSPLYVRTTRGLRILDVIRPSPMARAGLRSGDLILEVEGVPVDTPWQVEDVLAKTRGPIFVKFRRGDEGFSNTDGEVKTTKINRFNREFLGIIPVPGYGGEQLLEFGTPDYIGWVKRWIERRKTTG